MFNKILENQIAETLLKLWNGKIKTPLANLADLLNPGGTLKVERAKASETADSASNSEKLGNKTRAQIDQELKDQFQGNTTTTIAELEALAQSGQKGDFDVPASKSIPVIDGSVPANRGVYYYFLKEGVAYGDSDAEGNWMINYNGTDYPMDRNDQLKITVVDGANTTVKPEPRIDVAIDPQSTYDKFEALLNA